MIRPQDKITISDLKKLCRRYHIKGYSSLNREGMVCKINKFFSVLKIQKFIRSIWIGSDVCPITMEKIVYPCWGFRPKGISVNSRTPFIYYNLEPLVEYLFSSGNFRDPKTREPYQEKTLKMLDSLKNQFKIKHTKSLYKCSINRSYYRKKKEREEDLMVLEFCIDEVVSSMRLLVENRTSGDFRLALDTFHFPTYHRYFRNLYYKSRERAKQVLDTTIISICGHQEFEENDIRDFILQFLFTIKETYRLSCLN